MFPQRPSAEMPMPGGASQLRLIRVLESNQSLYELSQELPRLAADLRGSAACQKAGINVSRTANSIENDATDKWSMVTLLHSMHRSVVKSIVYGTVGVDSSAGWYDPLSTRISGVYVVGLARMGSSGKFLNGKELQSLIEGIERYMSGAAVIKSTGGNRVQTNAVQRRNWDWVRKVDKALDDPSTIHSVDLVRFMPKDGDEVLVSALVESLKSRLGQDPTGTVRQVQTPIYVGCSTHLSERLAQYEPGRWLRSVNKPLALTASVLEALGIYVVLVPHIAMRTWKDGQLPIAERLVTTLAASLVCQTGFNAIQAGGQGDLNPATLSIPICKNLQENVADTLQEIDRRCDFLSHMAKAARAIHATSASLQRATWELEALQKYPVERYKRWPQILQRDAAALNAKLKELRHLLKLSQVVHEMAQLNCPLAEESEVD